MQPEDVERELGRLWAKVSPASDDFPSLPPSFVPEGLATHEINLDTIALLKRQHGDQARDWASMLEAKERSLQVYRERQRALEAELEKLRERLQDDEKRVISEVLDAHSKLEQGASALEAERRGHEREQQSLHEILDASRKRLADEAARWKQLERQWEKREQQYLLDIKELQTLAERRQEDMGRADDSNRKLSDSVSEAKNALEKTLAELLAERQIREQSEKERAEALKKVDEVQKHFDELTRIWEEERAQWRELWDRERSTWETQRTEFVSWEESLRKERQAWHSELEAKEQSQLQFVSKVNQSLRESAETSTKVASALKILSQIGAVGVAGKEKGVELLKPALALIATAALVALAFPAWNYFNRPHFKAVATVPFALENPTSLAYDGNLLHVSSWDGKIDSFNPRDLQAPARLAEPALAPYHPAALVFGGELWSLDSAQARLIKHRADDAAKTLGSWATPGPAPTALAFDGESVWSYDAANKALYRHGLDPVNVRTFPLEQEIIPTAMVWVSKTLWVFDSKSRDLVVYAFKGDALRLQSRHALGEAVIGMAHALAGKDKKQLWVLAGPAPGRAGYALVKYSY